MYAGTRLPCDGLPEIVLFGRSNAGKSMLINRLAHNAGLARVAKAPGKTRYRHFFRFGDLFYLVDLPGYGFSSVSKTEKASWGKLVDDSIKDRPTLAGGILVVDARRPSTELDHDLVQWWQAKAARTLFIVASKADKLTHQEVTTLRDELPRLYEIAEDRWYIVSKDSSSAVDALRRAVIDSAKTWKALSS